MPGKINNAIIQMFHVSKNYAAKVALTDISLEICKNDFVFFSGPSGAGKSTLLKLLYLGETATEGNILIDGINLSRIPKKKIPILRRKFGIIFQDFKLISRRNAFENVALVLEALETNRKYIEKKVKSILGMVGMEERADAYPADLSGGEQQRIAVARALVGEPMIILADEPTGCLDSESGEAIFNILKDARLRGATVIIASHSKELINRTDERIINLKNGRIKN